MLITFYILYFLSHAVGGVDAAILVFDSWSRLLYVHRVFVCLFIMCKRGGLSNHLYRRSMYVNNQR
jgi:hypothetical protein